MIKAILELLKSNKPLLNRDLYIHFERSVRNNDVSARYQWFDGLQLNKKNDKVIVWISSENSEYIHSIPLTNIERNVKILSAIKAELERTIEINKKRK